MSSPRTSTPSGLLRLGFRLVGEPPSRGASHPEWLRWLRGCYLRIAPLLVVTYALLLAWVSGTWVVVLAAVSALLLLHGVISLSLRIRREERPERRQ
jgi:hypothetical protein